MMSSLGGLFGTKPRCKRNFLLENIRDVRKERIKKNQSGNSQMMKFRQVMHKVPQPISKSNSQLNGATKSMSLSKSKSALTNKHRQNSTSPKCHIDSGSQTTCDLHSFCRQKEGGNIKDCSREDVTPTFTYIDEENVPFRWTQVCPSVISHIVCHQSVQTLNEDDLDSLLEDGSIKYPSSDKTAVNVKDDGLPHLEWSTYADEDNSLPSESLASRSKSTGPVSTLPVEFHDISPSQQNTNTQSADKKSLLSESSEKHTSHTGDLTSPPPRSHYPFTSKTNGEGVNRRYKSQNVGSKNFQKLRIDESYPVKHNSRDKEQLEKPVLQLCDEIENVEITSLKNSAPPSRPPTGYQRGVIPKYLAKRISEQKVISRTTRNDEVNALERERRLALQEATKEFDALIAELNKMPVRTDTLRTKKRKIEIEKELDLLERRIRSMTRISDL